jgi:hypothetical protein
MMSEAEARGVLSLLIGAAVPGARALLVIEGDKAAGTKAGPSSASKLWLRRLMAGPWDVATAQEGVGRVAERLTDRWVTLGDLVEAMDEVRAERRRAQAQREQDRQLAACASLSPLEVEVNHVTTRWLLSRIAAGHKVSEGEIDAFRAEARAARRAG